MFNPLYLLAVENNLVVTESDNSGKICYNRSLNNAAVGENIKFNDIINHRKKLLTDHVNKKTYAEIPKISHHIWLTSIESPKEISSQDLMYIKKTLSLINEKSGWKNIFWTNNKNLVPNTIKELSEYNIIIKEINYENIQNFASIEKIYLESFNYNFAMPSDIISYMILQEFGGVYFDVDYELKQPIDNLLRKYSFLAHEEPMDNLYIGNALIGAIPNHPIINEALNLVKRNFSDNAPDYVTFACHDRAFTISGVGPAMFSIAFYNKANYSKGLNDIFLTDNTNLYNNFQIIAHSPIGVHYGSNTWKKNDEEKIYDYCRQCIRLD
jgi:hypothetical protein